MGYSEYSEFTELQPGVWYKGRIDDRLLYGSYAMVHQLDDGLWFATANVLEEVYSGGGKKFSSKEEAMAHIVGVLDKLDEFMRGGGMDLDLLRSIRGW